MSDDHLDQVLVSLVFSEVLELLLGLISNVTSPLRKLVRLVLCVLKFRSKDLFDLFLGLSRAELVLKGRSDLVSLVTLRDFFAHLSII